MIRFIGDIHNVYTKYIPICVEALGMNISTVQVGDCHYRYENVPSLHPQWLNIQGNHDDPEKFRNHPNSILSGTFDEDRSIFYLGGAESIDAYRRIEGVSWWRDEELSINELNDLVDKCIALKPRVIVSRDGPMQFVRRHFAKPPYYRMERVSRTMQALTAIFENHQPEYWVFGHYHKDIRETLDGTKFILLGIDSYVDLDV